MPGVQFTGGKPYLRVVGGNLVKKAEEGEQGAKIRKWETPTGQKGETLEITYVEWEGIVEAIEFKKTDYGQVCLVDFDDVRLSLNVDDRYFQDFAQKIFSADLTKPITIHPYDMEIDGQRRRGLSMKQNGEKLKNYFYDGSKNLYGYPQVDNDKRDENGYWKIYFINVTNFLVKKLEELEFPKKPLTNGLTQPPDPNEPMPEDLPWEDPITNQNEDLN